MVVNFTLNRRGGHGHYKKCFLDRLGSPWCLSSSINRFVFIQLLAVSWDRKILFDPSLAVGEKRQRHGFVNSTQAQSIGIYWNLESEHILHIFIYNLLDLHIRSNSLYTHIHFNVY